MTTDAGEPAFLTNLGFLVTYRCNVACPHCLVHAGPHRSEEMSLEDAFAWIDAAAGYRDGHVLAIAFTGGEPFHDLKRLRQLVEFTVGCGLLPTAVTNAAWAETPGRAIDILRSMPALRVLSISADAHHQRQIPFERVRNAVLAARALELEYRIAVCTEDEAAPAHLDLLRRLEQFASPDRIDTIVTFDAGRAQAQLASSRSPLTERPPGTACPSAATPLVLPDGRVYACVGPVIDLETEHPLLLGNLRTTPLGEILDAAERNATLHLLRVWGPAGLLEALRERGVAPRLPRLFVQNSPCSLCHALMSDPALVRAMEELACDESVVWRIAWARVHYLQEERMVELTKARSSTGRGAGVSRCSPGGQ